MNIDHLHSIEQLQAFLEGAQPIAFAIPDSKEQRYLFVEKMLKRFHYTRLKRKEKGVLIRFLQKITDYSRQQLTRMIRRYRETGQLKPFHKTTAGFARRYTSEDIRLLAQLDKRHDTPNGARVKKLCERAYGVFGETAYERLAHISVAHIYNLRRSTGYLRYRCRYQKTQPHKTPPPIGTRRKPYPQGKPGYIRIDTVHQGDKDGYKGVYHINAVDEVTQFEVVASVKKISEAYLMPVLEQLLEQFPFVIINFHSDNGSEYINQRVAKLLKKLLVEFTKSRPRQSNDNALVEGKNAAVVRKVFGYAHIPQHYAQQLNVFNQKVLNPYINYHRPCLFPTVLINDKGKEKKKYRYEDVQTPYEKFKSLPNAQQYLKPHITFEVLDDKAQEMTDNEAADYLQQQRKLLFKQIYEECG